MAKPGHLRSALSRPLGAWAWPFVLALVFTAAIAGWSHWTMRAEIEDEHRTLLADALTVQASVGEALAEEQRALGALAEELPWPASDESLLRVPAAVDGLRRLWISVTVLDGGNRVVAHVPAHAQRPAASTWRTGADDAGLSAHLMRALPQGGGRLVVRFAPARLLRSAVPWWLSRKYDVRLVDGFGHRVAGPAQTLSPAGRQSHLLSLEPALHDTFLELTTREARVPWWRTLLPLMMALFLASSAVATAVLRRRIVQAEAAERRWRTEAAWRRAVEDSLTVGLRARDLEGRIVHVNRAFCDLVGLPAEALLGQLPPMPYWPPGEVAQGMQRLRRNLAGGAPRDGYEARWRRADGTPLEVIVFEAPLVDAQGQQTGWMGSIVDVTERRKTEERERRQVELFATHARLTTLGEIASALAHQLNQPLTAIAGWGAGALRTLEASGYDEPAVLDALHRLGEQATEAGRIVQRIRGFLTRRTPQREPCRIEDLVERASALFAREFQRLGLSLRTQMAPGLPEVTADGVLIEQVLINLMRNACDALAAQGTPAPQVQVVVQRAGPMFVRVDVEDNGPGLEGRNMRQLSEPFFSTKSEGMGMGLAICRSVVEAHHGALEAGASALGGAMVSFTLPIHPWPGHPAEVRPSPVVGGA